MIVVANELDHLVAFSCKPAISFLRFSLQLQQQQPSKCKKDDAFEFNTIDYV